MPAQTTTADNTPARDAPVLPMLRMTVDQLGEVVRAAFEEGYIQGTYHTSGRSVMDECKRIASAFWERVRDGIVARHAAAPRLSGDA
jgi:hypothetical protein